MYNMANLPRLFEHKWLVQAVADKQKSTYGLTIIIKQSGQPKLGIASDIDENPTNKCLNQEGKKPIVYRWVR